MSDIHLNIVADAVSVIPAGITQELVIFRPDKATRKRVEAWAEKDDYRKIHILDGPRGNRIGHLSERLHRYVTYSYSERLRVLHLTVI